MAVTVTVTVTVAVVCVVARGDVGGGHVWGERLSLRVVRRDGSQTVEEQSSFGRTVEGGVLEESVVAGCLPVG